MEERLGEMRKGRRERIEKGSHCFFKSSGYDKLELKHKNLVFFQLIECIIKKKGINRQERHQQIFAFFLISVGKRSPLVILSREYKKYLFIKKN